MPWRIVALALSGPLLNFETRFIELFQGKKKTMNGIFGIGRKRCMPHYLTLSYLAVGCRLNTEESKFHTRQPNPALVIPALP
jgi:hypothetical protein